MSFFVIFQRLRGLDGLINHHILIYDTVLYVFYSKPTTVDGLMVDQYMWQIAKTSQTAEVTINSDGTWRQTIKMEIKDEPGLDVCYSPHPPYLSLLNLIYF